MAFMTFLWAIEQLTTVSDGLHTSLRCFHVPWSNISILTPRKSWKSSQRRCSWDLRMMTEHDLAVLSAQNSRTLISLKPVLRVMCICILSIRDTQSWLWQGLKCITPEIEIWGSPKISMKNLIFFKFSQKHVQQHLQPFGVPKHAQNCFWRHFYGPAKSIFSAFSSQKMTP